MDLSDLLDEVNPEPKQEPWRGYDFDKASKAVICYNNADTGAVVWAVGGRLLYEMEEVGLTHLDDLG